MDPTVRTNASPYDTLITQLTEVNKSYGNDATARAPARLDRTADIARHVAGLLQSGDLSEVQKKTLASQFHAYLANRAETQSVFKNVLNAVTRRFSGTQTAIEQIDRRALNDIFVTDRAAAEAFLQGQKTGACVMWEDGLQYRVLYKLPDGRTGEATRSYEDARYLSPAAHAGVIERETRQIAESSLGRIPTDNRLLTGMGRDSKNAILDTLKTKAPGEYTLLIPSKGNPQIALRLPGHNIRIVDVEPHSPNLLVNISRTLKMAEETHAKWDATLDQWRRDCPDERMQFHLTQADAFNASRGPNAALFHSFPSANHTDIAGQPWHAMREDGMWTVLEEFDPKMITTRANIPLEGIASNGQTECYLVDRDDSKEQTFSPRRLRSWVSERVTYNGQLKILKARRKVVEKEADIPPYARVGSYFLNEADSCIYVVTGRQNDRPICRKTSYFVPGKGVGSLFDQITAAVTGDEAAQPQQ